MEYSSLAMILFTLSNHSTPIIYRLSSIMGLSPHFLSQFDHAILILNFWSGYLMVILPQYRFHAHLISILSFFFIFWLDWVSGRMLYGFEDCVAVFSEHFLWFRKGVYDLDDLQDFFNRPALINLNLMNKTIRFRCLWISISNYFLSIILKL